MSPMSEFFEAASALSLSLSLFTLSLLREAVCIHWNKRLRRNRQNLINFSWLVYLGSVAEAELMVQKG